MYLPIAAVITILLVIVPFILRRVKKWRDSRFWAKLKPEERTILQLLTKGDFQNFKSLFERMKFDPNFRDPLTQRTLLMMCAPDDNKLEFAKYLIEKGCDINATDKKGMDMLFLTTYWTCPKLFNLMLQQKDLILDRSNLALGCEMNPLAACLFKCYDLKAHMINQGWNEDSKDENNEEKYILLKSSCDKWYAKAAILLRRGADPKECRRIVEQTPSHYKPQIYKQFDPLLDLFERWHNSKKVMLMNYHLAKERKTQPINTEKKMFAIEKLPKYIVTKIADEYF